MYEIYLLRGRGIETMLGVASFEIENTMKLAPGGAFSVQPEKPGIPPFESEKLKSEKDLELSGGKRRFFPAGKAEISLIAGFIAFELIVFLLCAAFPY